MASKKFYIALEVDGVPKFSDSPVAHSSQRLAYAEGKRLAAAHPGETFGLYMRSLVGDNTFHVFPQVKTYTGLELMSTAPKGVYMTTAVRYSMHRILVDITSYGDRINRSVLLVHEGGNIEPLCPNSWRKDTFVLTDETLELTTKAK